MKKRKYSLKREIVFTCITIFIIAFLLVYVSYRDFYGARTSNKAILTNTAGIKYKDNASDEFTGTISLKNEVMMSDSEGLQRDGYDFNVSNNSSSNMRYNIYLKEDFDMSQIDGCSDKTLSLEYVRYGINNMVGALEILKQNNYIIYSGVLNPGETKNFSLKLWIDQNSSTEALNKHLHLKVYIDSIFDNDNLLNYLKSNSSKSEKYYIDTDEATQIYKFKNSYRFIGAVPNNYVYFNCSNDTVDSCELWRIVGIDKVLVESLETVERVKLVRDDVINKKVKYDNIDYVIENDYIEEALIKQGKSYSKSKVSLLSYDDYRYTFSKGVDDSCFNDILGCRNGKKSYLNSGYDEWLVKDKDGLFNYISKTGSLLKSVNNIERYFRPVVYLKSNIKIKGGNGSKEIPYIIH